MTAIGSTSHDLRIFVVGLEDVRIAYLSTEDHVVGEVRRPGIKTAHNQKPTQETFLTLAYAAALTTRLGLTSGVLILLQRQTAIVRSRQQALTF